MNLKHVSVTFLTICAGASFASASSQKGFDPVQDLVQQRTHMQVHWDQESDSDRLVSEKVDALLKQPLTDDAAVQIALLNNPSMQATFEELGIAHADLVQAGLLQNPIFAGSVRFPKGDGNIATQFSISENLLDLISFPLRHRAATSQYKARQWVVTDEVLGLEADVRIAFYRVQGAQQMLETRKQILEATQISTELSNRQNKAGNLSALDWTNQQSAYHEAAIDFARNEAELYADREHLAGLMNVLPDTNTWEITQNLADLPANDPSLSDVQNQALAQRLDLSAAREEVAAMDRSISTSRFDTSSGLNVGVDTEKDAEGGRTTGPTFSIPVPLFDRNQAATAKAKAEWRRSKFRLAALEADIRSQVRLAFAQLVSSRHIVEYSEQNVLPLQEQTVQLSQKFYNFMLLSVYQLIATRQNQIIAQRDYLNALRDYWIAHAALEKVVGGRFELAKTMTSEPHQKPASVTGSTQEEK